MNVEEKLRIAIKNFEEAERLHDQAKRQAEEADKEMRLTKDRLAKAMHAVGDVQVRSGVRTYNLQETRDGIVDVAYTEFNGRILE